MPPLSAFARAYFASLYPRDRAPYDQGRLQANEYWLRFAAQAGVSLQTEKALELRRLDVAMWSRVRPQMLRWMNALSATGVKTALLSNMIPDMAAHARKTFAWMNRLTCQVLSFEVGLIKPDPSIYRHCLRKLGVRPSEALFVDDLEENVLAARALGIRSIRFVSVAQLRKELLAAALAIPLPNPALPQKRAVRR